MAENFVDHEILRRIGQKLNIRVPVKSEADLARIVERRLPLGAVTTLVEHGLKENEIYSLVLPRRTLQHRRAKKERLSREESDRAVRLARLVSLAEKIFGDPEAGMGWLRTTKKHFGDRTPIEMMATEIGSRLVEELLYQIDEGMAA